MLINHWTLSTNWQQKVKDDTAWPFRPRGIIVVCPGSIHMVSPFLLFPFLLSLSLHFNFGYANKVKAVVLGQSGVGKTSFCQRIVGQTSTTPDITLSPELFTIKLPSASAQEAHNLQIWDTAGQERFKSSTMVYARHSEVVILMFDISDETSLEYLYNLCESHEELLKDGVKVVVIGNKSDVVLGNEQARSPTGRFLAEKLDVDYFEISTKYNHGIDKLKHKLATLCDDIFNGVEGKTMDASKSSFQLGSSYEQSTIGDCCQF